MLTDNCIRQFLHDHDALVRFPVDNYEVCQFARLNRAEAVLLSSLRNRITGSYRISAISSSSTGMLNGSCGTATAVLACLPFSPKTSTRTSEAPFMTAGCS